MEVLPKSFFEASPRNKLYSAIDEFHKIDFKYSSEIEFSDNLFEFYSHSKQITEFWRYYYRIPITDERYLNATHSDILSDYLNIKLREFREEFEEPFGPPESETTAEQLQKEILEDLQSIKFNKDNYASEEYIKSYDAEILEIKDKHEHSRFLTEYEKQKLSEYLKLQEHLTFNNIDKTDTGSISEGSNSDGEKRSKDVPGRDETVL